MEQIICKLIIWNVALEIKNIYERMVIEVILQICKYINGESSLYS